MYCGELIWPRDSGANTYVSFTFYTLPDSSRFQPSIEADIGLVMLKIAVNSSSSQNNPHPMRGLEIADDDPVILHYIPCESRFLPHCLLQLGFTWMSS